MSKHLTGICQHCGKKKEEHHVTLHMRRGMNLWCGDPDNEADESVTEFFDSGQARLEANAEELLRAAEDVIDSEAHGQDVSYHIDAKRKLNLVIYKIYGKA